MAKAKLTPMDASGQNTDPDTTKAVEADFNPQTLSVSSHTLGAHGSQQGPEPASGQGNTGQSTGYSTTLTVELLFDTTQNGSDVQDKTDKIINIVRAQDENRPPRVQFLWGSLVFYGVIQSADQTLDYFSEEGVPLRATIRLSLTEYRREPRQPRSGSRPGGGLGAGLGAGLGISAGINVGVSGGIGLSAGVSVGTTPLTLMPSGDTVQGLAVRAGMDWKAVANANNVDNPRLLAPGTVLNLNAGAQTSST